MPHIERTVTVDKPIETVWAYLTDFTTTVDWDPGTVRCTRRSGDGGPGTVYDNTSEFAGSERELVYTVQTVEPHHRFVIQGVNDTVVATDTMTFRGDAARTSVTYHADFDFKGIVRLAAPLLPVVLKRLGDAAEKGLAEALQRL